MHSWKRIHSTLLSFRSQFDTHKRLYPIKVNRFLPSQSFDYALDRNISYIESKIADPGFNVKAPVDLILGVECVFQVIESAPIRNKLGFPDVVLTMFGWVFGGNITATCTARDSLVANSVLHSGLCMDLQTFWEVEENVGSLLTK